MKSRTLEQVLAYVKDIIARDGEQIHFTNTEINLTVNRAEDTTVREFITVDLRDGSYNREVAYVNVEGQIPEHYREEPLVGHIPGEDGSVG